jgi:hypothetical protein
MGSGTHPAISNQRQASVVGVIRTCVSEIALPGVNVRPDRGERKPGFEVSTGSEYAMTDNRPHGMTSRFHRFRLPVSFHEQIKNKGDNMTNDDADRHVRDVCREILAGSELAAEFAQDNQNRIMNEV